MFSQSAGIGELRRRYPAVAFATNSSDERIWPMIDSSRAISQLRGRTSVVMFYAGSPSWLPIQKQVQREMGLAVVMAFVPADEV